MIALARTDDVRIISDGADGWITVPDIKIPAGVNWTASQIAGQNAFFITFKHDGKSATTLWHGPHTIGANTYYVIDAPKRVLQMLKNQLGAANVAPLVKALRAKRAVRLWARSMGFKLVRNSAGQPVAVLPPLVICGNSPVDLDGDELEEATVLTEVE